MLCQVVSYQVGGNIFIRSERHHFDGHVAGIKAQRIDVRNSEVLDPGVNIHDELLLGREVEIVVLDPVDHDESDIRLNIVLSL